MERGLYVYIYIYIYIFFFWRLPLFTLFMVYLKMHSVVQTIYSQVVMNNKLEIILKEVAVVLLSCA